VGSLYHPQVKRKDGTIYEDPIWWAAFYLNGRLVRRSTKTEKKGVARRQLQHWEGNPREADPRHDRTTIEELAADFLNDYRTNGKKSLEQAEDRVNRLLKTFGRRKVVSIKTPEIRQYIADRQAEGYANATVNRDMAALKRMFSLGMQAEKIIQAPYIPRLDERNVRQGFLGDIEHLSVTSHLPFVLSVMADTARQFGWRKEELLTLQWTQVDLGAALLRLEPGTTKNDEGRYIVLTADLLAKLKKLWEETQAVEVKTGRKIPWVFHRKGKPVRNFYKAWKTACKKAGVGPRYFHDYRRTAVRNMEMVAVPRSVAMKITGHKTESVYRRYAIVDMAQLREATRRMEQRAEAGWPVAAQHEMASGNIQTTCKQGREQAFGPSAGS
jgi:integrase